MWSIPRHCSHTIRYIGIRSLQRILVRVAFPSPWLGRCWSIPILRKFNPGIHRVPSFIPRPCGADAFHVHPISGFSKNRHNPVMVYNDLMIRNITVHNCNKDRSQPVTIQCLYTWVGVPVDRRRQTGMICPNRALISVRIIVPFFHMASRPLSAAHQLILAIDIV